MKNSEKLLDEKKKELLANKLLDLANIAAGALIFGQFLSESPVNKVLFVIGIGIVVLLYWVGFQL